MQDELLPTEPHPAAIDALAWIKTVPLPKLMQWQEAFSSLAIEGNRLGQVCSGTLDRLLSGKPVGDRYLLGLAWVLKDHVGEAYDR